ncbi:MAG: ATP-binding protein [Firmicutes bacterium]|nr:ATP-binding protein [Bacillota bacterium]
MNYIERHIEAVVERVKNKKKVVIVTGPRQVGKSTMLRNMLKPQGVSYISLGNPTIRQTAIENPTKFLERNKAPIIIDEIQKAPILFDYIKEFVEEQDERGRYFLTGSQNFGLMKGVTESLAGRAGIVNMLGLSVRELFKVKYQEPFMPTSEYLDKRDKGECAEDIETIIHRGSFPELYETKHDLAEWGDYYASYLQSYIEKDVRDITNIQDMSAFIKFMKAIATLSGEQLNYVSLAQICGMDVNTTKRWVSILETSGLVYLLQPYYNNFNKRLLKTPKIYLLDTGLLCYLSGWNTPQQMVDGARWGHIFETFAVSEILKSYYNKGATFAPPLYYYRDKDKNEIDIIIEEAGTLYPVEIKTTSDPTNRMAKAFDVIAKVPDKKIGEGAIVCLCRNVLPLAERIWAIPIEMI